MNRLFTLMMILASLTVFTGFTCGPPAVVDTGFDLWCGPDLCAWDVVEGKIERVPTWHRSDYGVELIGNPVIITQKGIINPKCIEFKLQADHDDGVTIYLEMDFMDDGTKEYSRAINTDDFKPVEHFVTPPTWYESVRFSVRKEGVGRAVLAKVDIRDGDACHGAPIIEINDRPDGAPCDKDSQCASGSCVEMLMWRPDVDGSQDFACSGCETDADCPAGEACGVEFESWSHLYQDCGPEGRHGLGERCAFDLECSTAVCCEGVCAECCSDEECPAGSQCTELDWQTLGEDYEFQILPRQCSPGEGKGVSGAVCLRAEDCQSNYCPGTGYLKACFLDGRKCDQDQDCPLWPACLTIGIAGGECQ